jgi:glycosyltransferase involved in cell wall biosynthesis
MRILYHHRTRGEDAQGVHIAELIAAFGALGHQVEVVAPNGTGGPAGAMSRLTSLVPRRQTWAYELLELAYNAVGLWALARKARAFRPDFIYERYTLYTCCGLLIAKAFGIPFILEVNAPLTLERSPLMFRRLARWLERWLCSTATRTIVVSGQMAAFFRSEGVPKDRLTVMPNGVDPRSFDPDISGDEVRTRYGIGDKIVVGFVGWSRSWHNLRFAVEAFADDGLAERGGHLLIVGDGPAHGELVSLVNQRALRSHVTFTGAVPRQDVAKHIAAMDVTIQPGATPYASPIKLFEYMAMGRAILAVAQPNIEEVLRDGENALLFPASDQPAFSKALARLIEDAGLRTRLGQAALETVRSRQLFWEANAKRVLDLVTGGRPAPSSRGGREQS